MFLCNPDLLPPLFSASMSKHEIVFCNYIKKKYKQCFKTFYEMTRSAICHWIISWASVHSGYHSIQQCRYSINNKDSTIYWGLNLQLYVLWKSGWRTWKVLLKDMEFWTGKFCEARLWLKTYHKITILLDLHCNNVQVQPEIGHADTQRETQRVSISWYRELAVLFIDGHFKGQGFEMWCLQHMAAVNCTIKIW